MTKAGNASEALVTKQDEREPANIGEAWLAIMNEVGYVQKAGELKINGKLQYKFTGEAQLIEALRPVMLKYKVICVPCEAKIHTADYIVVGEKKTYRTMIEYTWVYTHVPSQTHMQVQAIGEGLDNGDKAAYKAATGALKYALRQAFLIETGDDPDKERVEEEKLFKNSATRNEFTRQLIASIDKAESTSELTIIWNDNRAKIEAMESGEEYDAIAAETVMTRIKVVGKALRESEAMVRNMDAEMDAKV